LHLILAGQWIFIIWVFASSVIIITSRLEIQLFQKQNKNDQPFFDKLTATDPKEREEINKLANATF